MIRELARHIAKRNEKGVTLHIFKDMGNNVGLGNKTRLSGRVGHKGLLTKKAR